MKTVLTLTQERLAQLTATFGILRNRVREAVASEMAKAVGDAVRDLLTALLRKSEPKPKFDQPYADDRDDEWSDDQDWDEPPSPRQYDEFECREHETVPSADASRTWAVAITCSTAVLRWCLTRQFPTWIGIGLGLAVGSMTLAGGPLVLTAFATLAAAVELATMAQSNAITPFD